MCSDKIVDSMENNNAVLLWSFLKLEKIWDLILEGAGGCGCQLYGLT